jgi:hypothetical protein
MRQASRQQSRLTVARECFVQHPVCCLPGACGWRRPTCWRRSGSCPGLLVGTLWLAGPFFFLAAAGIGGAIPRWVPRA